MKALFAVVAAALATATLGAGAEPQAEKGTVDAVQMLAAEAARRPHSQAEDLYKFLHQALFGPGHAISDPTVAAEHLEREIESLGPPLVTDTLCDTLGGDPTLVRVHLRPLVQRGFPVDPLLESFVATANEVNGKTAQMAVGLELVAGWLASDGKHGLSRAVLELGQQLRGRGYPAMHHSRAYLEAYRPAYRVVAADMASRHGWCNPPARR